MTDRLVEWLAVNSGSSGASISKGTGIGTGSLYPRLASLEASGEIIGQWERPKPRPDGSPRRRLYWVTNTKTPAQR